MEEEHVIQLPELGYSYEALEPHLDARTMEIHHTKHHAYVAKLNASVEGHGVPDSINTLISDIKSLPEEIQASVRNNGGGHANHTLFGLFFLAMERLTYR